MFPEIKAFDVKYALKKCNGDFQSALDHLLNMQYLEETGQQTKGVDGFAEVQAPAKRKGKGKKRKGKAASAPDPDEAILAEYIQEAKGMSNISFIDFIANMGISLRTN